MPQTSFKALAEQRQFRHADGTVRLLELPGGVVPGAPIA